MILITMHAKISWYIAYLTKEKRIEIFFIREEKVFKKLSKNAKKMHYSNRLSFKMKRARCFFFVFFIVFILNYCNRFEISNSLFLFI